MSLAALLISSAFVGGMLAVASRARGSSSTRTSERRVPALASTNASRRARRDALSSSSSRPAWTRPVWVPARQDEVARLLASACECVGELAPVVCLWTRVWPGTPFPPAAGDHLSLFEAWSAAQASVATVRELGCSAGLSSSTQPTDQPLDLGELVRSIVREPAMPGSLYSVREGDRFSGDDPDRSIVWQALYYGTYSAAMQDGLDDDAAHELALAVAHDPQERSRYEGEIQCSEWNAKLFATFGHDASDATPSVEGLAISLAPVHDDVLARLLAGSSPVRTIGLGQLDDATKNRRATGAGSTRPLLWLPSLRRDALLDARRRRRVDTSGLVWSDGSRKTDPPPAIVRLGVLDVPAGVDWRCGRG